MRFININHMFAIFKLFKIQLYCNKAFTNQRWLFLHPALTLFLSSFIVGKRVPDLVRISYIHEIILTLFDDLLPINVSELMQMFAGDSKSNIENFVLLVFSVMKFRCEIQSALLHRRGLFSATKRIKTTCALSPCCGTVIAKGSTSLLYCVC